MSANPESGIFELTIKTTIKKVNFDCHHPLKESADLATNQSIYSMVGAGDFVVHAAPSYEPAKHVLARLGGQVVSLSGFDFSLFAKDGKRTKGLRYWPAYFHLVAMNHVTQVFVEADNMLVDRIFKEFSWQSCDLVWHLVLTQSDQKEMTHISHFAELEVNASPSFVFDSPNGTGMWTGYATLEAVMASDTFVEADKMPVI